MTWGWNAAPFGVLSKYVPSSFLSPLPRAGHQLIPPAPLPRWSGPLSHVASALRAPRVWARNTWQIKRVPSFEVTRRSGQSSPESVGFVGDEQAKEAPFSDDGVISTIERSRGSQPRRAIPTRWRRRRARPLKPACRQPRTCVWSVAEPRAPAQRWPRRLGRPSGGP